MAEGGVSRVVIDSLAEMVFAAREGERFPACARSLASIIRAAGASLLITSETTTLGGGASANALTPDGVADLGGGGDFHDALVEVEAAG